MRCGRIFPLLTFLIPAAYSQADIIQVPEEHATIQAGIDAAAEGDTVELANGTYQWDGNRDLDFGGKNLVLRSASGNPELCVIDSDGSELDYHRAGSEGGAIWMTGASPVFDQCLFENNHVDGYGAAATIYGGAPPAQFNDCRFIGNSAQYSGAIDLFEGGAVNIDRSLFWRNTATELGGAITDWDGGDTRISSSTFAENDAPEGGHIYFGANFKVQLDSNVFAYAPRGGSFALEFLLDRQVLEFTCCNVSGNTGGDWSGEFAIYEGEDGNFSADPEFCGEIGSGNFLLESDSPCAPAGNDCSVQIGVYPVGCEDTVAATSSWSQLKRIY